MTIGGAQDVLGHGPDLVCSAMRDADDPPAITRASSDQRERFMHCIMLGFATDPLARFAAPTAHAYLDAFMALFGACAFDHGGAWIANGGQVPQPARPHRAADRS